MKVAIAGSGNVAQYLIEELTTTGHELILLTRQIKPNQKYPEQRQTDYTIPSLIEVLSDQDALVSTVADFLNPESALNVQLNMLEATKQSKTCKSFIPSEWTSNVEDYPEQPMFLAEHNKTLHSALKAPSNVRWTILCNSWFTEYIVPRDQRHLRDLPGIWPMDYERKIFTIPGPGWQVVDFTPVRDVAKAVAALISTKEPWEQYTYVSGEQLTWNQVFSILNKRDPEWKSQTRSLAESIHMIADKKSRESVYLGQFDVLSYSGASEFPKEKVQRDRAKYFRNIHFRTVEEVLDDAARNPDTII